MSGLTKNKDLPNATNKQNIKLTNDDHDENEVE